MRVRPRTSIALAALLAAPAAAAQVDVRTLIDRAVDQSSLAPLHVPGTNNVSALVRLPAGVSAPELVPIAPGFAAFEGSLGELHRLSERLPPHAFSWAPARRLLLDQAAASVRAPAYRAATGASGRGVIVGIVDSGLDLEHPDLHHADGSTRVAWLIDLSRPPAGRQPDLEAAYACSSARPCAVFSGADIEELRRNDVGGDLPDDAIGHGTHVASLAASSGARFAGVAPEATLIVAKATRSGVAGVFDADMLLATRFVFERASELGLPAVVNLSLGGDFGQHDGSSVLEQALAALVGDAHPGRAVVVAAGNSGSLFGGFDSSYPEPFGVHTEVHVPPESEVRVPILTLPGASPTTLGSVSVWIAGRPGDRLAVGLDGPDGEIVEALEPGAAVSTTRGALSINLINGLAGSGIPATAGVNAAMLVLEGEWSRGASFALRFTGNGSPRLWVQASTSTPGSGALFPRAARSGTITVPASSPALIAVGATLNRVEWTDVEGEPVALPTEVEPGSATAFSSAGPTADGRLKPDIVAPGAFVIGAMANSVDPRAPGVIGSMFDQPGFVVDDTHGISSGTSMAAPLVSGAVALLLERNPSLTQQELLGLLQAGARPLPGLVPLERQAGPGTLDLERTLEAEEYAVSPVERTPDAAQSFLALADEYAHPDPAWPVRGLLLLRDAGGHVADGFDVERLTLAAEPADRAPPLARLAPGVFAITVFPRAGSGGQTLRLRVAFDGAELETRSLPIAVDRWVARGGYTARGGCSLTTSRAPGVAPWLLGLGAIWVVRRRSQLRQVHRAARRLERREIGIERVR